MFIYEMKRPMVKIMVTRSGVANTLECTLSLVGTDFPVAKIATLIKMSTEENNFSDRHIDHHVSRFFENNGAFVVNFSNEEDDICLMAFDASKTDLNIAV